jgi:hypothetical protein
VERQSDGIPFSISLVVSFLAVLPGLAQESRWKELDAQIDQLQSQGRNKDALSVAEEALHVADATFGAEHPNTAAGLQKLGFSYHRRLSQTRATL